MMLFGSSKVSAWPERHFYKNIISSALYKLKLEDGEGGSEVGAGGVTFFCYDLWDNKLKSFDLWYVFVIAHKKSSAKMWLPVFAYNVISRYKKNQQVRHSTFQL